MIGTQEGDVASSGSSMQTDQQAEDGAVGETSTVLCSGSGGQSVTQHQASTKPGRNK